MGVLGRFMQAGPGQTREDLVLGWECDKDNVNCSSQLSRLGRGLYARCRELPSLRTTLQMVKLFVTQHDSSCTTFLAGR